MPRSHAPWQPDVTVAAVVLHAGRLLCVEERIGGRLVLNQPAGHLEPGETLHEAVVREALEETGWRIRPIGWIGSYQWQAPAQSDGRQGRYYLRTAFAAEALTHDPLRPLDDGIVQALWLSPEQLLAERARHRSPLVWRVIEDYLAGQCFPLHAVAAL